MDAFETNNLGTTIPRDRQTGEGQTEPKEDSMPSTTDRYGAKTCCASQLLSITSSHYSIIPPILAVVTVVGAPQFGLRGTLCRPFAVG